MNNNNKQRTLSGTYSIYRCKCLVQVLFCCCCFPFFIFSLVIEGGRIFPILLPVSRFFSYKNEICSLYHIGRFRCYSFHKTTKISAALTFMAVIRAVNVFLHQLLSFVITDHNGNVPPRRRAPVGIIITFFGDLKASSCTSRILSCIDRRNSLQFLIGGK